VPRRVTNGNLIYLAPDRSAGDTPTPAGAGEAAGREETARPETVDLEAVADKVYRLMQRDLTLENERIAGSGG
jgi:hypothetical protein